VSKEVITLEDWVTIRNLKSKNPFLSNRALGKLLDISKNTVKSALQSDSAPKYERKESINQNIVSFQNYIYEALTVKNLKGSRILNDIKSKGYSGSPSAFYRYLGKIELTAKRTFQPYETSPGEQAQFDWSPYTVSLNGVLTVVYVFSYILGFSRYRIYEASLSQSLGSTFEALENSIIATGGIVGRVQTDNAGCFVINAGSKDFKWNSRYLNFCGHYSFEPTRSMPARPWSKGKVERPFNFLEEQFIKGNEFSSFEDFCKRLKNFQDEVNNRKHHTTQQTPQYLYNQEINSLKPLPKNRFVDFKEEVRKVSKDCLFSFEGSRYSVPYLFATKEVWLKVSQGYRLQVYSSKNQLIAEHILSLEKKKVVLKEEHYKNHSVERGNWSRQSQSFLNLYPDFEFFVEKLKNQKGIDPNYHISQILDLGKYYCANDVQKALSACLQYNIFTSRFIGDYLLNHCRTETITPCPIDKKILESIESVNIKRDLSFYSLKL
jgi:transposase